MSNDIPDHESTDDLPEGWGRLRAVREERGMSLGQVSAHLKLTPRQLEAIERGDLSALPGSAFSRGFVRNYARFLGLDPAPFVALIDAVEGSEPQGISTDVYSTSLGRMPTTGRSHFSALPAALLVLVLAGVLGTGWYNHWFESREESALLGKAEQSEPVEPASTPLGTVQSAMSVESAPSQAASLPAETVAASGVAVTQSLPVAQSSTVEATVKAVTVQSGVPAARQSQPVVAAASAPRVTQSVPSVAQSVTSGLPRIVLAFDGDSWVNVSDATGKSVFSRLNQAGAVQEVQGNGPFTLVIGNAPQVHMTWRGKPVDLTPYIKGDVARITVQ